MENLTGISAPVTPLLCVVPCKLYFTQCETKLKEQLGPEEKALLEDLLKTQQDMDGVTAEENFILGFRLGVQLMAECLAGGEDD